MQIQTDIRAVDAATLVVGTHEALLDFCRQPPVLLAVLESVEAVVFVLEILRGGGGTSICWMRSLSMDLRSET